MDEGRMKAGGEAVVVLITVATREEAEKIACLLVEKRLAACINIVPRVRSLFSWEGKLSQSDEVLLVGKSRRARFRELVSAVKTLHSYDVPEIIALPILEGSADYLQWIHDVTT